MCIYIYIYILYYINLYCIIALQADISEFRDVEFEDVVLDHNRCVFILYLYLTQCGVTELLLSNTTSSNTTSLNSQDIRTCFAAQSHRVHDRFGGTALLRGTTFIFSLSFVGFSFLFMSFCFKPYYCISNNMQVWNYMFGCISQTYNPKLSVYK